jgi:hypothetical protein
VCVDFLGFMRHATRGRARYGEIEMTIRRRRKIWEMTRISRRVRVVRNYNDASATKRLCMKRDIKENVRRVSVTGSWAPSLAIAPILPAHTYSAGRRNNLCRQKKTSNLFEKALILCCTPSSLHLIFLLLCLVNFKEKKYFHQSIISVGDLV